MEKTEKKNKKKKSEWYGFIIIIISIIIAVLLIFGITYIAKKYTKKEPRTIEEMLAENYKKKGTENNYIYNGFSFIKVNNIWYTQVQRGSTIYNLMFNFGPKEVENISITGVPNLAFFSKKYVYLTFDPNVEQKHLPWMAIANSDLSVFLYKVFNVTTIAGCTINNSICEKNNAVIIDCSSKEPVIMLNVSNNTSLVWDNNCLIINGYEQEIDRAATRFLYKLVNIVK